MRAGRPPGSRSKKRTGFARRHKPQPPRRALPLAGQHQPAQGQPGIGGEKNIFLLVSQHHRCGGIQPVLRLQDFPHARAGLAAGAAVFRRVRAKEHSRKNNPVRGKQFGKAGVHRMRGFGREKPPPDTGLVADQEKAHAFADKRGKRLDGAGQQFDRSGISEVMFIFDDGSVAIKKKRCYGGHGHGLRGCG